MVVKSFIKYPGGKSRMIDDILPKLPYGNFTDVFTGGGSIAIAYAQKYPEAHITMNDIDDFTFAIWEVVVNGDDKDIKQLEVLLRRTPTIDLFNYNRKRLFTLDDVVRAYYGIFFHKTTFSGMFTGSPIGGQAQKSQWKVGCHYNADNIIGKIRDVRALLQGRTTVTHKEFGDVKPTDVMYFDPPYVEVGDKLYLCAFSGEDHKALSAYIKALPQSTQWLLSYNEHPLVRELYDGYKVESIQKIASMTSFAEGGKCREKTELLISKI